MGYDLDEERFPPALLRKAGGESLLVQSSLIPGK
jgi:hypothetical protein